jgi:NCS1 family nucleobase:cation symporter-1
MSEAHHVLSTNEYEREPVPEKARKGPLAFLGMYAGEHAAGTEFMIGPLFLAAGASLNDLIFGLLIGNILAVLTWRYLVVPIAMKRRLTLYYQLEKVAGGSMVKLYNVTNGVLFCFLAGAMITVSASAVGVPLDIRFEVPEALFGLGGPAFTTIVVVIGALIALVAATGYNGVARFANLAAPWMILVFAACGVVSLGQMDADSWAKLQAIWSDGVQFVQITNGPSDFGLAKIIVFAWLANAAMHLGMSDLSIFRFSSRKSAGWAPAAGMFLGHYMAWIAAALMLAALIAVNPEASLNAQGKVQADPGFLAFNALGWTGIICVIIAGWTTANPTIYRAGLAFQTFFPNSSRMIGVLIAGGLATVAGAFPQLSAKLLGFVGTYGMILGPMGAVIFVNHYFAKKCGFVEDAAAASRSRFNVAVLLAWLIPVLPGLYLILSGKVFAAFLVVPAWIVAGALYIVLAKVLLPKPQPSK